MRLIFELLFAFCTGVYSEFFVLVYHLPAHFSPFLWRLIIYHLHSLYFVVVLRAASNPFHRAEAQR